MKPRRGIVSGIGAAGVTFVALLALAACQPVPRAPVTEGSPALRPSTPSGPAAVPTASPSLVPSPGAVATPTSQEVTVPAISTAAVPLDLGLQKLVGLAQADLARRLGIDAAEIEVVEIKAVVWPDTGLGCPQPGMKYRQVPQDGSQILLRVATSVYDYHSGGGREPFLCKPGPAAPKPTTGGLELPTTPGSEDR